jgi:hypothetical protein
LKVVALNFNRLIDKAITPLWKRAANARSWTIILSVSVFKVSQIHPWFCRALLSMHEAGLPYSLETMTGVRD